MPGATGESPTPAPVLINHATLFKYLLHDDDNEVNNLCSSPQLSMSVFKDIYLTCVLSLSLYPETRKRNGIY